MRVLLDENLDWRLVRYFDADFQVMTVSRLGWKGKPGIACVNYFWLDATTIVKR